MSPLEEFKKGFDQWLKISCYLGFAWIFIDILPLLPVQIAERIIDSLLSKVGF
jgi:hypothetical protein